MPGRTMFLSDQDIAEITAWRRHLHAVPELSGCERATAREVCAFLAPTRPDHVIEGLGGHGVAMVYEGHEPGPTVLLRAELDAMPIAETGTMAYRSQHPGIGHLCGHDGHMATLAALARGFGRDRPQRGRLVLMFQPAEETGHGAGAVIADAKFAAIRPDMSFAFHNMPGVAEGRALLAAGPVNCASRGLKISLEGKTAHASQPEHGLSPLAALAVLLPGLTQLGTPLAPGADFSMVTVTHCQMGEAAFGVSPGAAEIWATLRTLTGDRMAALCARAEALARTTAASQGLGLGVSYADIFAHVENAPEAVAHLARALDAEGIAHERGSLPMRASEDFGRFGQAAPAAMFFLGAGETHASLHHPDYDFPDALMPVAARVLMRAARGLVGASGLSPGSSAATRR